MSVTTVHPLYQQIYDDLKQSIKDGEYKVNQKIPSEMELSQQYSVSRITVRRAIEDLCSDGYLTKMQGRGTFVGSRHIQRRLEQSLASRSFTDMCTASGAVPGARVVDKQIVPAKKDEADFFSLSKNSLMVFIRRIRTADELPIADERVVIPYDWASQLLTYPLKNSSIFEAIEILTGRKPVSSKTWTINAVKATTEQARLLEVATASPLILSQSFFVDKEEKPICLSRDYFVGGRYELSL